MNADEQKPAREATDGAPENEVRSVPGPWMLVVAGLALAGAAALYVQLLDIGRSDSAAPPPLASVSTTHPSPTATFHSRVAPTGSAARTAPGTGGSGGKATSSAGANAAEGGHAPHDGPAGRGGASAEPTASAHTPDAPLPPTGMVFVPWPQKGPFPNPTGASSASPAAPPPSGFFIDRTEVPTAAYRRCVLAGRCVPAERVVLTEGAITMFTSDPSKEGGKASPEQLARAWKNRCNEVRDAPTHPTNCVNFASARDYCRFVASRLPTAAEWTRAARLDDQRKFAWGDEQPSCDFACFGRNGSCLGGERRLTSCPVGAHPRDRSATGLLDMSGNVAEWVRDEARPKAAPHDPAPRLVMGGSFGDDLAQLAIDTRRALPPVSAHVTIGFRCARDMLTTAARKRPDSGTE
ncbi:MAG: SUMF1/EgtB/PvdO family nonheme iron enzyme [Polyangiaceae bacterium]